MGKKTLADSFMLAAKPVFVLIAVLIAGLIIWRLFFLPISLNEALFRYRLGSAASVPQKNVHLSELAAFEWDEVCARHPYDGDLKYPKYGRTYQAPSRTMQDGVWVLLFIKRDGTPTYIAGSCTRGGAHIHDASCIPRAEAILRLSSLDTCPAYIVSVPDK